VKTAPTVVNESAHCLTALYQAKNVGK